MPRSFAVVRWFSALLLVTAATSALAQEDPVAVQQQLFEALARGDVAGALALFTDDAVIDAPSGPCLMACVWAKLRCNRTSSAWQRIKVVASPRSAPTSRATF